MFITKGIVDLHHGEIRVFSNGEGTGCTFTVDLPMTRKIDPLVVVNNMRRRSTRERLVGLYGGQSSRHLPTSSSAVIPASQGVKNQAVALNSLQPMNPRPTSPLNQRPSGLVVMDDPVPLSNRSLSMGRQSLRDLAEHDRMVTSAARQADAMTLRRKQSVDREALPTHNPDKGGASTGRPSMSPPPRGEHTRNDAVVVPGSDYAADPPSQQLHPTAMTMVTSSPSPPQELVQLSSKAVAVVTAALSVQPPSLAAQPSSSAAAAAAPSPLTVAPSPKSRKQSQNEQLPQGPVYHVLVVDDSSMTRKMLMKTLRNGGIIHPILSI